MWLKHIQLTNVASFAEAPEIRFSKGVNLLVGPNNAGKSTILRAIYALQGNPTHGETPVHHFLQNNTRIRSGTSALRALLAEVSRPYIPSEGPWTKEQEVAITVRSNPSSLTAQTTHPQTLQLINLPHIKLPHTEPNAWIYPFLSQRAVASFNQQISAQSARVVQEQLVNLFSKLDPLLSNRHSAANQFSEACNLILGVPIGMLLVDGGKAAGLYVSDDEVIPLDKMGDGSKSVLGLLVQLCTASGKLFLIDEPEATIHPKALKALLEVIIRKADANQFIIATHSNIVVKMLGGLADAQILRVNLAIENAMTASSVEVVENSPQARIALLEDLGYDVFDFELHKGYLLLEESSAERIIRGFLIRWFCSPLEGKLKTIACQGRDDVGSRFKEFVRLFVFVHTTPIYRQRAWVLVDGDEEGKTVIADLRHKFRETWSADHFQTLKERAFEKYYPIEFQAKADAALAIQSKKERKAAKEKLLSEVIDWIESDPARAKEAFAVSARDVIEVLNGIAAKLENP